MDWLDVLVGVFAVCGAFSVLIGDYRGWACSILWSTVSTASTVERRAAGKMVVEKTLTLPSRAWHPPPWRRACHRGLSRIFAKNFRERLGRLPADPFPDALPEEVATQR